MNIPGTDFPFPVIERKGPPALRDEAQRRQRRGLLAKIHIAKQQMGLNEGEYEMFLRSLGVASSADLTLDGLEKMIKLMKYYGWKPVRSRRRGREQTQARLAALQARCGEQAGEIKNGEKRLA